MSINHLEFYPIMGEELNGNNTISLDMSTTNLELKEIDLLDTHAFEHYINNQLVQNKKVYGIGGYLEMRNIYQRSRVFEDSSASKFRNIHLGIDIWSTSGKAVHCPINGTLHSFRDNKGFGNYGPTIILMHSFHGELIYSLYGHLSHIDLQHLKVGQIFEKGEKIGHLGSSFENGNWPPHLHFQLIKNLKGESGDYPGVCSSSQKDWYKKNCPDPTAWLGFQAENVNRKTHNEFYN
ncbi:peptidoglycan DD-metalloendopeptidase family protein [Cyclobacterium marinum]|uniref:Peptidase M23 n=1 Tax=Cyclobacterium marinum (strain ATCC 25205 / DSM 745 / LMG 13164 / NCIMB 1802) TaxID=880070 RepID=G0IVU6_CYCMS|nr:peptidoglycan DD-metalloendopeptidase family protein [Cyclobacterium marinum]AEL24863.1 Peptidase M23 [Cyclobacterium marinum DSM 745]MBI0401661.1 peptidoglycan DD-metalloendopeptidase family protein [Cyclobacterium marinum]MBR9775465.1 peptidoglycan DD-metalloendopeptidase family protein [Cytophagales bacterium]